MKPTNPNLTTSQRGGSMLEFAVVTPVLLMTIIGIVDLTHWMTAKNLLTEATMRAAEKAAIMPNLDIDPEPGTTSLSPTSTEFQRLTLARDLANGAGTDFLAATSGLAAPGTGGPRTAALIEMVYSEDRVSGAPVETRSTIMVLLPGDCADVPELAETICNKAQLGIADSAPRPNSRGSDCLIDMTGL
jgi:hypothetical protein